ncbi:MAG TPA: DUF86 domain-containing protein [Phycisphaerales bacterium]|nr:DUF86 domain-containing protein [Phycisphaerales bacterium]HMP38173.1 DUF86 domain-containing protein [Phycisphaerales bacterium]
MRGDVVASKVESIERCLARIAELCPEGARSLVDRTVEEAVILNLQRACEQAIRLASHLVAVRRPGLPQEARHAFALLCDAGAIDAEIADRMKRMIGFRTVAIHEHQRLGRAILGSIIELRLEDFRAFVAAVVRA